MNLVTSAIGHGRDVWNDLGRDGKGWILLAVSAGWFLSIGVRYMYPALMPFLRESFVGMDLTDAGFLLSALWLGYAGGQFPGGILGDKLGEGNILVLSVVISTAALVVITTSFSFLLVVVATIGFGFASGLYGPHRFTIFTDIYTDRSGTAVGVTMAAGSIGNTVLPAVAVAIAGYAGWRAGFGVLLPLFAATGVAVYLRVPKRTSKSAAGTDMFSKEVLREFYDSVVTSGIPVVVTIHIIMAVVSNGFLGFYPTYLIQVKGFSAQVAAIIFGLYFAVGVVLQPLAGLLRDRFGSRVTIAYIASMVFVGLVALQYGASIVQVGLLTVLISHRNGLGVVTNTYIADQLDPDIKGSGLGLLRTSWLLFGGLSPIFVGFLGDLGQLNLAFLILAGVAGLATLLTVFVPDSA